MATKRRALGRGLSALIPEAKPVTAPARRDYFLCPIEDIKRNPRQPRTRFDDDALTELADSIREQGIIQPLVVRARTGGGYELIAGERRWRAAQKAGLHEVPVIVKTLDDKQALEVALVENLQREDLDAMEEAQAYRRLIDDHNYSVAELAERVGRDRSTLSNSLRLLKLPVAAQRALIAGQITSGHARALLAIEQPKAQQQALRKIVAGGLSVRQAERLAKTAAKPVATEPPAERSANERDLEARLTRSLKTRVRLVTGKHNRGRIEVNYASLDELDRLLDRLLG